MQQSKKKKMDDLDHSIHMSENDWSIFYEESEECVLLQPSLACSDDSGLSDLEDSGNLGLVLNTGQRDTRQSLDVNSSGDDSNHSQKQDKNSGPGVQGDVTQAELCLKAEHVRTGEENTEKIHASAINHLKSVDFQSTRESEEVNKNRNVQTECDLEHATKSDPLSRNPTGLNVNELLSTQRNFSDAGNTFSQSVEKERWFVTVNENLTRRRERASVKKKQRQKKLCKRSRTCHPKQQKYFTTDMKVNEESDGEKKAELIQNFAKTEESEVPPFHEFNDENDQVRVSPDSLHLIKMCNEEENTSEMFIIESPKEQTLVAKTVNHETDSSLDTLQDTFASSQLKRAELDEFDDIADFLSSHSYDSDSYLSATESVEEFHALIVKKQLLHSSLCQTSDNLQPVNVSSNANTPDLQMYSCDNVYRRNVAATNYEGYESSTTELNLTFPPAGGRASKMSADDATGNGNIHSETLRMTPDASAAQSHQKDRLGSSNVSSLTASPRSAADSPETFAKAAGQVRPVYAISAFWDEMEKLTINDILHLKMGGNTSLKGSQEFVIQSTDASPRSPVSLDDGAECRLSDGGLMDMSDAADSDYFTQPDESKPDCSSRAFSTSDVEEEYWQFLSASGNPSPDPDSKTPDIDASFFPHEEECASSEGIPTPVPSEDHVGQKFDDQEICTLTELTEPRRIMKSKSMHNVRALNTDSLSLPSFGRNEESAVFQNRCRSWEENTFFKVNDRLQTLNSVLYVDNADLLDICQQMSFPEIFEKCLKYDKANTASQCGKVYDPKENSIALFYDLPLSALNDEMASSSFGCNKEQPIPIFSYSHPTVRDLTFPKLHYAFFGSHSDGVEDISPMRFLCHPYLRDDRHGSWNWKNFVAIRKINFHDKGSIRCGRSGVWMFPAEEEKIVLKEEDPTEVVFSEGEVCPASSQLLKEFNEQQRSLETIQTKQESKFSTLKQSDMCLVCIAVASWVLKSSDPDAADAWKAGSMRIKVLDPFIPSVKSMGSAPVLPMDFVAGH